VLDAPHRIEAIDLGRQTNRIPLLERLERARLDDPAAHQLPDLVAGDREVDRGAGKPRDGDADDGAARIDDGAAGGARMHAAGDLNVAQVADLVAPERRDARLVAGDLLPQLLAERETEDVDVLEFREAVRFHDGERIGPFRLRLAGGTQAEERQVVVA